MKKMMGYCGISEKEMTSTRNYPYMSSRTLAKLWVGTYWSYYRETNSRSAWARGLYAHPLNSFIDRGLSTPTRSKPGWYPGGAGGAAQPAGNVAAARLLESGAGVPLSRTLARKLAQAIVFPLTKWL